MKRLSIASISILVTIAGFSAVVMAQSDPQEDITFVCQKINSIPTTIARTASKDITMFVWSSQDLGESQDSLQERCEQVSSKLQTYYDQGQFNYLTTGRDCPEGRESCRTFVCAVEKENEGCRGRLLFPIKLRDAYDTPGDSLQRIMRIRVVSDQPIDETHPSIYVNLEKYLNGSYLSN